MGKGDKDKLDTSKISFPFDAVTWRQIRRVEPKTSTLDGLDHLGDSQAAGAHYHEVMLAENAFERARYGRSEKTQMSVYDATDVLSSIYEPYGISTGHHQTRQLVAEFMKAAADQGRKLRGPRGGEKNAPEGHGR